MNPVQQTLWDMEVLYKTTMELYESYFTMLEAAIENTPDTDIDRINELNSLVQEANEALQADMAVFDKVVSTDVEALMSIQDELKIQSIYDKLKK
ncbi:hypothetical protein KJ657_04215 [Patescibacteria group bacterium]|nr:hypothetical protein [Patescibacteria group bacterium]MBU1016268.1 hypothetical protein [Patescibacteria group bacterium]MBU1685201.1 hypothetical protein [Patescibacteria group bacterium]MBU1938524.1 hypothetical protein [Patescibacteria group bacterium]